MEEILHQLSVYDRNRTTKEVYWKDLVYCAIQSKLNDTDDNFNIVMTKLNFQKCLINYELLEQQHKEDHKKPYKHKYYNEYNKYIYLMDIIKIERKNLLNYALNGEMKHCIHTIKNGIYINTYMITQILNYMNAITRSTWTRNLAYLQLIENNNGDCDIYYNWDPRVMMGTEIDECEGVSEPCYGDEAEFRKFDNGGGAYGDNIFKRYTHYLTPSKFGPNNYDQCIETNKIVYRKIYDKISSMNKNIKTVTACIDCSTIILNQDNNAIYYCNCACNYGG
jgi:hypothetical protein